MQFELFFFKIGSLVFNEQLASGWSTLQLFVNVKANWKSSKFPTF